MCTALFRKVYPLYFPKLKTDYARPTHKSKILDINTFILIKVRVYYFTFIIRSNNMHMVFYVFYARCSQRSFRKGTTPL